LNSWRLILSPPLDGAANMALDEAIMTQEAAPTLRLYSWAHPAVSMGFFQKTDAHLTAECEKKGVDLVKRPTGGRAVFHDREITYSVCSSYDKFPLPHTLKGVYSTLAGWLANFFNKAGIEACLDERKGRHNSYMKRRACFLTSTPYELKASGKKICGSAQKRNRHSFLQHGSILLDMDVKIFSDLMGLDRSQPDIFTTLRNEGCRMSMEGLLEILISEFETTLNCRLKLEEPSEAEITAAANLRSKYESSH